MTENISKQFEIPADCKKLRFDRSYPAYISKNPMGGECGMWVKIRPCGDKQTYLGIFMGSISQTQMVRYKTDENGDKEMHISDELHNPAIYVPDLKKIVFGMESWWGKIKSPKDLKSISNSDIDDVWYVKALNEL